MRVLLFYYLTLVVPAGLSFAADGPPVTFVEAHSDIASWVFGIIGVGFAALILRAVKQNDNAIEANKQEHQAILTMMREESEKKWAAIDELTKDLGMIVSQMNHLKGEHDILKVFHTHRRNTDCPEDCDNRGK